MNNNKSLDWLKLHSFHCLNLSIESSYIEKNIYKVDELLSNLNKLEQDPVNMDKYLLSSISSKIDKNISDKKEVGLLCSGGEDSVYLLLILVKYLKIKPKLFCYETKNNQSDLIRLKKIADIYNLELNIFNSKNLDRENAYNLFIDSQKRPPNDLAQPVHNALYFEAVDNFKCDIVIDGQMCDTVLLSNPQNHFLLWLNKYNFFIKTFIKALNYIPFNKENKLASRISMLNELCNSPSSIETILSLVNIKNPNDFIKNYTYNLVQKHGEQLVFSAFFYSFLLELRERDKYLICPKVYSPFDDFNYAIMASFNLDQILGLLIRKKPIRHMCKKHFPKLFRLQNTLPFELE